MVLQTQSKKYLETYLFSFRCQPQDPTTVTRDTASQDPLLVRARVFVGCLKRDTCTTEDVISLFSMYGPLRGVSLFAPQGCKLIELFIH